MATEVVGRLRTDLILNSANFSTGLTKAGTQVRSFAGHIASAAKSVQGFLGIGLGGFGAYSAINGLKQQARAMEELGKQSKITGVGVEALAGLQYAAKLSETEIGDLNTALRFMGKNLSDAGVEGKAAQVALADLRVNVKDLRTMQPEQQFLAIAAAIEKIESPADRLKLAMTVFGKGGAAVLPMIGEGAEGIRKLADEFKRLSGGLSETNVKQVMAVNDAVDRLGTSWEGLKTQALGALAAMNLEGFLGDLTKLAVGIGNVASAGKRLKEIRTTDKMSYNLLMEKMSFAGVVMPKDIADFYADWSAKRARAKTAVAPGMPSLAEELKARSYMAAVKGGYASTSFEKWVPPLAKEDISGKVMPLLDKINKAAWALGNSALNTAARFGMGAGGLAWDAATGAGTAAKGAVAGIDAAQSDARRKAIESIFATRGPSSVNFGGGAEKGSAAAYSAIVRAMGGDMAKKETLRIQKQQLDAALKAGATLREIRQAMGKEQVLNLDAL